MLNYGVTAGDRTGVVLVHIGQLLWECRPDLSSYQCDGGDRVAAECTWRKVLSRILLGSLEEVAAKRLGEGWVQTSNGVMMEEFEAERATDAETL